MRLERFKVGDELVKLGRKLNLLVDYCKAITPKSGENTRIRQTHAGAYISADRSPGGGGGEPTRFIKSVSYDSEEGEFTVVLRADYVHFYDVTYEPVLGAAAETTWKFNATGNTVYIVLLGDGVQPEYGWYTTGAYGADGADDTTDDAEFELSGILGPTPVGQIALGASGGYTISNADYPKAFVPRPAEWTAPFLRYSPNGTLSLYGYAPTQSRLRSVTPGSYWYNASAPSASIAVPSSTESGVYYGYGYEEKGNGGHLQLDTTNLDTYARVGYIKTDADKKILVLQDYTRTNHFVALGITQNLTYVTSVNFNAETTSKRRAKFIDGILVKDEAI